MFQMEQVLSSVILYFYEVIRSIEGLLLKML